MRLTIHIQRVLAALTCVALTVACTNGLDPKEIPTPGAPLPTPAPRVLGFPDDNASHDAPMEWWYYNGHLEADDGSDYSFHFVIFQIVRDRDSTPFEFGQAGITDVKRGEHFHIMSEEFVSREIFDGGAASDLLGLDLGNFSLGIGSDGTHSFEAIDESSSDSIRLQTRTPTEVMLHDGSGWMDWPFGWTYYYSYPRIEAEGQLTLDGNVIDVTGEVWFDHQWGDFFVVGKPAGWQWFAIHLDDGTSLMITEVRGTDGQVIATDGTIVGEGSEQRILDPERDGIVLDVLGQWTSPDTGGEYPARWRLQIDSMGLDVVLEPSIAHQEVPAMPNGNKGAAYWEGRVDVLDAETLESVGLAFAELSGYVDPEPLSWRADER